MMFAANANMTTKKIQKSADTICAMGIGLSIGTLIGLTFACIISL
jgi:hypothetical protein